jgi:lipopolysaccharide transport system ATP-binding protein
MSALAFRVNQLSKLYSLGRRGPYKTLRESLSDTVTRCFRRSNSKNLDADLPENIWALKDVSFDILQGEVVGIIGRNGAGKSTLLKILSRITEPTQGSVEVYGRVGSLLEVGTGFHPELTGRENIYLNGAILGMKRTEINRRFDEIVAFAETEKFLDTPVKHYSSGMYMRLAFAVAAHLEPEILLVDEVLSVGDAAFQNKCLGKMGDVARSGRTVLFVSHSMASIATLCTSAILMRDGAVAHQGRPEACIDQYLAGINESKGQTDLREGKECRRGSGDARIVAARLTDTYGVPSDRFECQGELVIEMEIEGVAQIPSFLSTIAIRTRTGITVLHLPSPPDLSWSSINTSGAATVRCRIPQCGLYPGSYVVSLWIGKNAHQELDWVPDALTFSMEQGALTSYGFDMSWRHGLYLCENSWSSARCGSEPDVEWPTMAGDFVH